MSSWNGNRFSVYTSEEKSVLGLIKEMGDQTNYNSDEIVRLTQSDNKKVSHQEMQELYKIDKQANFTGSWFGIKRPTQSDVGLAGTVEQLIDETIPGINSQLEQIATLINKFGDTMEGYNRSIEYAINNKTNLIIPNSGITLTEELIIDVKNLYSMRIECNGVIKTGDNVINAITIKNLQNGVVDLTFEGGGNELSNALRIINLKSCSIKVNAVDFKGTVFNVYSNYDDNTYNYGNTVEYVKALNCGRAIMHGYNSILETNNNLTDAFGSYNSIWDYKCKNTSIFTNSFDINIKHYENYFNDFSKDGLSFINCGSLTFNNLLLGGKCRFNVTFDNCPNVNIDYLFCCGETTKNTHGLKLSNNSDRFTVNKANMSLLLLGLELNNATDYNFNNISFINCINQIRKNSIIENPYKNGFNNAIVNKDIFINSEKDITINDMPISLSGKNVGVALVDKRLSVSDFPYSYKNENAYNVMAIVNGLGSTSLNIDFNVSDAYKITFPEITQPNSFRNFILTPGASLGINSNNDIIINIVPI